MKQHLPNLYEVVEVLNDCGSVNAVQETALALSASSGVEHLFAGVIPTENASRLINTDSVLFGGWPKDWTDRYFRRRHFTKDPTIRHVQMATSPLRWQDLANDNYSVMNEARSFGLSDGITVPMVSLDGIRMGMSFAGRTVSDDPSDLIRLSMVASVSTARVIELLKNGQLMSAARLLTPSELRCLQWVAEGKTNWEISTILGLSEKTIEKHLTSMMRKTDALNRTQLVVTSIRTGILQ